MISKNTVPGTYIICIDDGTHGKYNVTCKPKDTIPYLDGLTKNHIYTVRNISPCVYSTTGYVVILNEIIRTFSSGGFALERFDYLQLPKSITKLLNTVKIKEDA